MAGRDPKPLVLVVDDDEIDVVVVNRALSPLAGEIDLRTAHDGQEALDLLAQRDPVPPITLVLLDLNMHRMNGFSFLEALAANPVLVRVAVFVMTSSWRRQDMVRAYDFPIAGYIVKSEEDSYGENLVSLVRSYLELVHVV
jgi:CheY-like chemotaxis protein